MNTYWGSERHKNALRMAYQARRIVEIAAKDERVRLYEENPKKCKQCGTPIDYEKRVNTYCSQSCGATHNNIKKGPRSDEIKRKISESMKNSPIVKKEVERRKMLPRKNSIISTVCKFCGKVFEYKKFPSDKCRDSCSSKECLSKKTSESIKGKCGGYRENSGIGKCGWYHGYFCQSTYELAFVIYCLDHDIKIERNKEGFLYTNKNGDNKKYFPDFIIGNDYYEIKGFERPEDSYKWKAFPHTLHILFKKDILHVLNYVKQKYGQNLQEMYDNHNKQKEKKNKCEICGNPCINITCSRSCSGKRLAQKRKIFI